MKKFSQYIAEEVKREQKLNGKKFSVSYHVEPTPSQKKHITNIFVPYAIMYTKDGYDVTIRSSRHIGLDSQFVLFRTKGGKSQPMVDKLISTNGKIRDTVKEERFGIYEGTTVPLEQPMIEFQEEKDPELNSPKRSSGKKKYVVYVRNPKTGNIKKIEFGDEKGGLTSKINDRGAAKNFAARHNCDTKTDKMSPGYWACRLPKYAKELGLKGGGNYFW